MASLQLIKNVYYIRFRCAGRSYRQSLGTADSDAASAAKKQVEVTFHWIKTGLLPPPPACADVVRYLLSGGKDGLAPTQIPPILTLRELQDNYFASLPVGAKEESSLKTEKGHFKHLLRILKGGTVVAALTTDDMQRYIARRAKEKGYRGRVKARTIRKEVSTFRNVWNNFALPRKIVVTTFRAAFGKLNYPKERERPPFQTWEQIERQIARGGLSKDDVADVWDCLFLDTKRIAAVLSHVRDVPGLPPWVCPAFVTVAHTGCRRGEIMRSLIQDWDIGSDSLTPIVRWREKKKDRNKQFTYRQVSVTPLLRTVMTDWLAQHPGGKWAFCDTHGRPITKKEASYWFKAVFAGSPWIVLRGWHVFRHSFVSCLAAKGVDQRIIDASVGHQTEEMRLRYRHLFPHKQHEVLAAVFAEGE